jgi:hypothetical protein
MCDTIKTKNAKDLSVPMGRVQLLVLPFIFASLLLMIPYALIWGLEAFSTAWLSFFDSLWFLPILFGGIVVHELLHAITWKYLAGLRWNEMKLGFQWKTLTPYAHAKKPMKITPYRWGAVMPALVLGFLPYFISLSTGIGEFFVFGVMFITAAGGDFWILYVLRKEPRQNWVADHPENAGCIVYEA